jgi:RNA polymerase sigma-70 factor (ECF subfamily)
MPPNQTDQVANLAVDAFRSYATDLRRYLSRRVRRGQDVDDLAQEVFARLLRVRDAELIRSPLPYLLGIAAHVVHEFHQRQRSERVTFDSEMADTMAEFTPQDHGQLMSEATELHQWLERGLKQLPPSHRAVLLLVKRDGLSYTEAATRSGLSVHTVEKYLVEARARLRVILADH